MTIKNSTKTHKKPFIIELRKIEQGARDHIPTYNVRVRKRSMKQGVKPSFFTNRVSNMSNTGMANICSSKRKK